MKLKLATSNEQGHINYKILKIAYLKFLFIYFFLFFLFAISWSLSLPSSPWYLLCPHLLKNTKETNDKNNTLRPSLKCMYEIAVTIDNKAYSLVRLQDEWNVWVAHVGGCMWCRVACLNSWQETCFTLVTDTYMAMRGSVFKLLIGNVPRTLFGRYIKIKMAILWSVIDAIAMTVSEMMKKCWLKGASY